MSGTRTRVLTVAALGGALACGAAPLLASPALASPATTGTTSAAHPTAGCKSGTLPAPVLGDPGVKAQSTEGVYLFHDSQGYEIRTTHPGKTKVVVTGTLTAAKGFAKLDKVRLEKGDFATETANHKSIAFRFTNFGGLDGFHAYADCSAVVKADFHINGKTATTAQVFLGKDKVAPISVPLTIDRTKPSSALAAKV